MAQTKEVEDPPQREEKDYILCPYCFTHFRMPKKQYTLERHIYGLKRKNDVRQQSKDSYGLVYFTFDDESQVSKTF